MEIPNVALYVKPKWADKILNNEKIWEIRGSSTKKRGRIGILKSGNKGFMDGHVELIDCFRVTRENLINTIDKHCVTDINNIKYKKIYAWILKNPYIYNEPIQINPKKGSIIWVKIT